MGNATDYPVFNQSDSKEVQTDHSFLNTDEQEYFKAFDEMKRGKFLHECPNFGKNLGELFPKAMQTSQSYYEMVSYLQNYDPILLSNQLAKQNSLESTLLDRFFMLCLGNIPYFKYKQVKLSWQNIQLLMLDYYRLFVAEPKIRSVVKVIQFIDSEEVSNPEELVNVKLFAEKLREFFPHVQKYLKDYYTAKFRDLNDNYRILQNFNSKILQDDAVVLALKLPQLQNKSITQLYNSEELGTGFYSLEKHIVGYTGPWLLLVEHRQKNIQGHWQKYVFGSYQNGPITEVSGFQGDLTGFIFTVEPKIQFMTAGRGDGGQNYFMISSGSELLTKHRKGIGFGGKTELKNFKLWIDQDIDKSTVYNGYDQTYGHGPLAGVGTEKLNIKRIEIWGLGSEENLRYQEQYWELRNKQITKMRKVNKKEFINEAQFFMENVFAHRDQVGEVEKLQSKHQQTGSSAHQRATVTFKGKQNENPLL